ncbi:hypothetical protein NNC19_03800 [Clostridium sp. SHJSY1]|uniref:hypothetical protein n=1 Tax=Clostridium sp. SHJSY1 TaxID=2942483 RepID=UPI0028758361|nr:hypothetical protein [Clostridium sp. SHJSY1]MDS0524791.1 hypothetical protein [Clostridium sp. SHJSY1]
MRKKNYVEKNFNTNYSEPSKGNFFTFFLGIIVFLVGIFMVFQNTTIYTGFTLMSVLGFTPNFGILVLPLLIGVVLLFFKERSILGWFLIIAGILVIAIGIFMGLSIYFRPVSLIKGIFMFGTIAAGIGLILKGLFRKN